MQGGYQSMVFSADEISCNQSQQIPGDDHVVLRNGAILALGNCYEMRWYSEWGDNVAILSYYISVLHCIGIMIAVEENRMFTAVTNGEFENKTKQNLRNLSGQLSIMWECGQTGSIPLLFESSHAMQIRFWRWLIHMAVHFLTLSTLVRIYNDVWTVSPMPMVGIYTHWRNEAFQGIICP